MRIECKADTELERSTCIVDENIEATLLLCKLGNERLTVGLGV